MARCGVGRAASEAAGVGAVGVGGAAAALGPGVAGGGGGEKTDAWGRRAVGNKEVWACVGKRTADEEAPHELVRAPPSLVWRQTR